MDCAATPTQQTTTTTMRLLFVLFATTILRTSRVGFVLPTLTIMFATTSAMHLHTTQTTGSGIRVLLIHGLDSSSRTWSLFGRAMRNPTTAMDQRTCGLSENGDVRDFDQDALVDDIHELVCGADASTTKKVVLLGHSLGGRIALGYAAKHPGPGPTIRFCLCACERSSLFIVFHILSIRVAMPLFPVAISVKTTSVPLRHHLCCSVSSIHSLPFGYCCGRHQPPMACALL